MERNPYAPPKSNVEPASSGSQTTLPASRLYSPKQIAVATFLGSPLAGGWFVATNYRELGQDALATQSIWWGIAGAIVMMFIAFLLPDNFPNSVLPIACAAGVYSLVESKLGGAIKEHQAAGGPLFSWWRVVGVSLLCALILVAVIFGVLFILAMLGLIDA
jgi:hypothetical protein